MKMDSVLKEPCIVKTNMSSKYVAPAKRVKVQPVVEPPPPPPEKKFEDEFPVLTSAPTVQRVWGGPTSFAEKAREWNEKSQKDSEEAEARKRAEIEVRPSAVRILPRFHNVRRFVEQEEPEEELLDDSTKPASMEDDESGWTLVERKVRKKRKTLTEVADEELTKISDGEQSDSVWDNDKELHETCWDERP